MALPSHAALRAFSLLALASPAIAIKDETAAISKFSANADKLHVQKKALMRQETQLTPDIHSPRHPSAAAAYIQDSMRELDARSGSMQSGWKQWYTEKSDGTKYFLEISSSGDSKTTTDDNTRWQQQIKKETAGTTGGFRFYTEDPDNTGTKYYLKLPGTSGAEKVNAEMTSSSSGSYQTTIYVESMSSTVKKYYTLCPSGKNVTDGDNCNAGEKFYARICGCCVQSQCDCAQSQCDALSSSDEWKIEINLQG